VETRLRAAEDGLPGPGPPEDLVDGLAGAGFSASPSIAASFYEVGARLCISEPAEEKFTDLVLACLDAPSPDSALTNLHRFLENLGSPVVFLDTVVQAPPVVDMLVTTLGSSQYMADILIRNPGYLYWLMDNGTWAAADTAEDYTQTLRGEADLFSSAEGKLNALRRAHRKELLKIGVRDLLGETSTETITERLSNLADAIAQVVLEVVSAGIDPGARHTPDSGGGFAVIAMGKLGGRELNYSSDIDLVYVCENSEEDQAEHYVKLARAYTSALSEMTAEGYFYRVDLRLRPDGQSGPLVNSETSMRIYYENRGRPWEFQAMLKARTIAGDIALGQRFLTAISSLVFNPSLPYSPLEDISRMRVQIRENIPERERSFNIKLMSGGIRDIEFTVQTFQLLHGHNYHELQDTNTMATLAHIGRLRLIRDWEGENLAAAYRFFRLVEHRLQMMHQIKTHTVPESPEETALLARRVSRGPLGDYTADSFLETLSRHLNNVRTFSDSFFSGEDVHPHSVLLLLPEDDERAEAIIGHFGITDVRRAMHVLHTMAYGSFPNLHDRSTRTAFEELLPYLLEDVAATGDPDRTLVNVSFLAEASRSEPAFYNLLKDSPSARKRVVAIAGCSSYLTRQLCTQMEYFEPFIREPRPKIDDTIREVAERIIISDHAGRPGDRKAEEWRNRQREWLERVRIAGFLQDHAARRMAGILPAELTGAVRSLVKTVFDNTFTRRENVALFALGSFAVGEPRLFSDLDVIVVTDNADIPRITSKIQKINQWFGQGNIVKLDFRLRGEGASAPLVHDLSFYQQYFETRMSLWERVAFAKCRLWWGDEQISYQFFDSLRKTFDRPFTESEVSSLLRSRESIESLAPQTHTDLETKRSPGGRYDIEYLTAIGMAESAPGESYDFALNTYGRLGLLMEQGLLDETDFETMVRALTLFTEVEYMLELQEMKLPRSGEKAEELGRYLSRSFEFWGAPEIGDVSAKIRDTKIAVRGCFDKFVRERI
jgi:glutamate-ammonia-ligase adenylyltransferase